MGYWRWNLWSIFVEFDVNFQNSTLHNQHQVCLAIVRIKKKNTEFLARVSWSSCLVYVLPNNWSVNLLLDRRQSARNWFSSDYFSLIASVCQELLLPVFFWFVNSCYFIISTFGFSKLLSYSLTLASNLFIFNFFDFTFLHFQIKL